MAASLVAIVVPFLLQGLAQVWLGSHLIPSRVGSGPPTYWNSIRVADRPNYVADVVAFARFSSDVSAIVIGPLLTVVASLAPIAGDRSVFDHLVGSFALVGALTIAVVFWIFYVPLRLRPGDYNGAWTWGVIPAATVRPMFWASVALAVINTALLAVAWV